MNKDMAITYLKEINKGKDASEIVTRLYYGNHGRYVQDLSFFINGDYMSGGLVEAIRNGQTLTIAQQKELQNFIIEKYLLPDESDKQREKENDERFREICF